MTVPFLTLNDGVKIPQLGFGVWQVAPAEVQPVVAKALEVGYNHIDTAAAYNNEEGVGRAIAESGIARDDLFVTTKLWNDSHKKDAARKAIETSLEKLGLDHLDLYLIHWPATKKYGDAYIEAWDALQEFKAEGLTRSIGVSNFTPEHLTKIADATGVTPAVNQVELHPFFPQAALREFHAEHGIVTEAWSPLGRGELLEHPVVAEVAAAHGVSPAQAILRWHVELGSVPIPKSRSTERQAKNLDIFGFQLDQAEVDALSGLERGRIWDQDPDTHEEF